MSAQGANHPHPKAVTDPLFRDSAFFDPNDLVQVKYEMLRSIQQEERSVVEAAQASGLSRPAFYVTQELFQREGLPGLLHGWRVEERVFAEGRGPDPRTKDSVGGVQSVRDDPLQ